MTRCGSRIPRRDFLRTGAAGALALPLLGPDGIRRALSPPMSRVALVRTSDRTRGVTEVLKLMDLSRAAGKQVVLKPNFNSADATPGSTHNDTLSQMVVELQEADARKVTLGESSGPPRTRSVMERKGTFDLAHDLGFEVVNFEELAENEWVHFKPPGTHWPEGFHIPRLVADSEYYAKTCCLKTHQYGGVFTMSLKLSVGITPKNIRGGMHRSPDMRRMIAELNRPRPADLILLDGIEAFTDGGPSHGTLKRGDVMIAGDDPIAVDAVGLAVLKDLGSNEAIMGRDIFEQEQIARAVEMGLGVSGPGGIEIVTGDAESAAYARRLEGILARG